MNFQKIDIFQGLSVSNWTLHVIVIQASTETEFTSALAEVDDRIAGHKLPVVMAYFFPQEKCDAQFTQFMEYFSKKLFSKKKFQKLIFTKNNFSKTTFQKHFFKNPFFFFKKYSFSTANFINAAQPHVIVGILPCTNTNLREVDNKELREVMDVNVAAFTMFAEFPGVNIINIQHPDDPFIVDNNSEEDNRSIQFLQRIHDRSIGFLPKFEEVQKPRNKQGLAGKLQVSTETAAYLFPSRRAITAANMRKGWKRLGGNVVRCGEM